jgi:hypothetical protein
VGWDVSGPGLGGVEGRDCREIPVRFYTPKFTLRCELWLIGYWAKRQPDKRYISKCKEFYRPDQTGDLDHLR